MIKKISFLEFDVTLAVRARQMLVFESRTLAESMQEVWQPTQKFLETLAKQKPKTLCFIREKPYKVQNQKGWAVRCDIVCPKKKIAYIGTIVDRQRAVSIYKWLLEIFEKFPDKIKGLRLHGPMTVIRWWLMCSIPVNSNILGEREIETGIRRYLNMFAPSLSGLPIAWLDKRKQEQIENFINKTAKQLAKPQTQQEKEMIFSKDI